MDDSAQHLVGMVSDRDAGGSKSLHFRTVTDQLLQYFQAVKETAEQLHRLVVLFVLLYLLF